jgi:hypothetical protein
MQSARIAATCAANRDLILLYRDMGPEIVKQQETMGWKSRLLSGFPTIRRRSFQESTNSPPITHGLCDSFMRNNFPPEILEQPVQEFGSYTS